MNQKQNKYKSLNNYLNNVRWQGAADMSIISCGLKSILEKNSMKKYSQSKILNERYSKLSIIRNKWFKVC